MRPPPRRTVHEWAEAERVVPAGTSAKHGRWKSRPFQQPVLEALTDPKNREGTLFVAPSQLGGKTEFLLNAIAYFIACVAAPQIFVTYSLDMAKKLSKRFAKTIRSTPALACRVREARSRNSDNTILEKGYDGGEASFVGANSAGGLSMAPKRVALFDEIDRYPASAGTEGDPIGLALARLASYWNRVIGYVTSPGIRETSRSWRLWQRSDQCEWHVACPDCATEQVLAFDHVVWDKDDEGNHLPETAAYACASCASEWDDLKRWTACNAGRYIATAPFRGLAGFRISGIAIADIPLAVIVKKWVDAQGNPEELKVFKNTVLAEWWDEQFRTIDETGLMGRREAMPSRDGLIVIPAEAVVLTAGVDLQDNRLEASVYAWGAGEECWCLAHEIIRGPHDDLHGDPTVSATWDALDRFLLRPWPRALGGYDFIRGAAVDTGGHHTQAAYDFCGARFRRRTPDNGEAFVFAVKGFAGGGDLWPRGPSKVTTKVPLWSIRVDVAKDQIYGRLALAKPGPGYIHFPDRLERPFFDGLTAEKCETTVHRVTRRPVRTWKLKVAGTRNEPLDCAVYALSALKGIEANGFDLAEAVRNLAHRVVYEPPPEAPVEAAAPAAPPARPPARREGWLGDTSNWLRR